MKTSNYILFLNFIVMALTLNSVKAEELQLQIKKNNFTIREKTKYEGESKDTFYLKHKKSLPAGTLISYDPENSISKVLYNNGDTIKRSSGDFIGPITIISIPGKENTNSYKGKKLYISESVIYFDGTDRTGFVSSFAKKEIDLRRLVTPKKLPKGAKYKNYLKAVTKAPKGTKFTFDPNSIIELPFYKNSAGKIKKSSGRYVGPLRFKKMSGKSSSEIDELNRMKLYTFEKGIDMNELNQKLYTVSNIYKDIPFADKALWDGRSYTKNWSKMAKSLIIDSAKTLIENPPSDIKEYCPKFKEKSDDERAEFWVHLISTIAKYESGFQPGTINDEGAFGSLYDVVSRGILQISYDSIHAKRHRDNDCDPELKRDLHHPVNNIKCGISLFKLLTVKPGKNCISCKFKTGKNKGKFAGIARYWSTLRPEYEVNCSACSSGKAKIGHKSIVTEYTKKLSVCN